MDERYTRIITQEGKKEKGFGALLMPFERCRNLSVGLRGIKVEYETNIYESVVFKRQKE